MILYNGASGGLGKYLAEPLHRAGGTVHALAARLEDRPALVAELSRLDPGDAVTFFHLAARVSVPACEADPSSAHTTNVALARSTVATILDWASRHDARARVIYVSSGHVYAAQPDGTRLAEDAPTLPRSVYAQTKLAAEQELLTLTSRRGVPMVIARVFGILAPLQAPNYVLPALVQRVRDGQLGGIPGLDFSRDYLDARDVCEDLRLLASAPWPSGQLVVNVCSGLPVTIRKLLGVVLMEIAGERADNIARSVTAAPGRPDDIRWLVGDPSRFIDLTGNPPQRIPLKATVADAVRGAG